MVYFFSFFIVALLFSCVGDTLNRAECEYSFEELCEESNTLTLTWGTFEGHATNENGDKAVIEAYPKTIGIASKYGFKVVSSNDNMIILSKA